MRTFPDAESRRAAGASTMPSRIQLAVATYCLDKTDDELRLIVKKVRQILLNRQQVRASKKYEESTR